MRSKISLSRIDCFIMSPVQDDPFYSPKRRLLRAKKHVAELDAASAVFLNSEPYRRIVEPDIDGVAQLHKIKLAAPFPEELSDLVEDALDSLRAVLDHTAYCAAVASGKGSPEYAFFPFSNTAENWENRANGLCKDVPGDIVALFRSFKPYKGGNDPLWALNEIRNSSQHAILVPVGHASFRVFSKILSMKAPEHGSVSFDPPIWTPGTWDGAKNEMVIFRADPGTELDYDIEFSPSISFGDVPVFANEPVLTVLNYLARMVESVLLATEAECRRLGLIT
jgi:hypothetical protein